MTLAGILQNVLINCLTTNHDHTPQDDLSQLALMCNQGIASWGFLLHSKATFCTQIMFSLFSQLQPHHGLPFIETTELNSTLFPTNILCCPMRLISKQLT